MCITVNFNKRESLKLVTGGQKQVYETAPYMHIKLENRVAKSCYHPSSF